ncbi:DUF2461 domain-containing protein [Accumulibacter sp.]|uniref:DUF2461 domain-containing protein n=1 Tax=Accumulibacter sp. TaxID=2053492 RepID=UPI0026061F51|nr:DUF2461 domain-containing protein [Accumulibacter sp.]HNG17134.1 DUF2461 domain-containing protein [Accumulibacter sp.]HNI51654.1 DUF2461 domain-containing protein [Accumulibacter sp.]
MFSQATLSFLDELAANNNREWFAANQARYESLVREPALAFIAAMAPELASFAPHFRAEARKIGGSLMRVQRDTRFARDKRPYKTNIGIHFRHQLGKDVHAPGFYVHIASDGCFLGAGCWHPEPDALARIRTHIAEHPERWFAARDERQFAAHWALAGECLSRPPRGYATDHPAIDDLKRKDFIALAPLAIAQATDQALLPLAARRFAEAAPLISFLCAALGAPY